MLKDKRILVTCSIAKAQRLASRLQQRGAQTIILPTIDIDYFSNMALSSESLSQFTKLIFVSQHAVQALLQAGISLPQLPQYFAVGQATADVLMQHGIESVLVPQQVFNSEGLLALSELTHVSDDNIGIVCGESPRHLLQHVLSERGARVTEVPVYRRILPTQYSQADLQGAVSVLPEIIVCSSKANLNNLCVLLRPLLGNSLYQLPLLVISESMLELAQHQGFNRIVQSQDVSNDAIIACLQTFFNA